MKPVVRYIYAGLSLLGAFLLGGGTMFLIMKCGKCRKYCDSSDCEVPDEEITAEDCDFREASETEVE